MEKLESIIIIALAINFILMLPLYQNLTGLIKNRFFKKLFSCEYCLTFWASLSLLGATHDINYLVVAITAPVITVMLRRALSALPIPF